MTHNQSEYFEMQTGLSGVLESEKKPQQESPAHLFSDSPARVGVEAALLGLLRGFRGVVSSRPSALGRLGIVWNTLGSFSKMIKNKKLFISWLC